MSGLKGLVQALDPRGLARNAARVEILASSAKALRQEVRAARGAIHDLASQLGALERQIEQLIALRTEESHAAARLDALETVLDAQRVSSHVRDAVNRCAIVRAPVPHAIVPDVFPGDVYRAVVEAVPPAIFFDRQSAHAWELLIPPKLAPTQAMVTWAFVADLVQQTLAPIVADRFRQLIDREVDRWCPSISTLADAGVAISCSQGRIVLRQPGYDDSGRDGPPWRFLTIVFDLAQTGDSEQFGSRVGGVEMPFRPNTLLVVLDSAAAHAYVPIPHTAPQAVERHTLEFQLGLDPAARRRLLPWVDADTRRTWEALGA